MTPEKHMVHQKQPPTLRLTMQISEGERKANPGH
uniref:Uncharacterized protein n=1 Tax=Rhizophora mucronata TaxID=61149 RepID=A0A2P2Q0X2_RHIMU